jgi:hypothetical protein
MAFVGLGHYVVVVLHVGGSEASDIKLLYNVNLVLTKLGSRLVRFRLLKRMSMLLLESCMRKLALS